MYAIGKYGELVRVDYKNVSAEVIEIYLGKQRMYAEESFSKLRSMVNGISNVNFDKLCKCGSWITGFLEPVMLSLSLQSGKVIRVVENSSCYSFDVYTSKGKVVFMSHPSLLDDSIRDAVCVVQYRGGRFETVFNGVKVELRNILNQYLIEYLFDGKSTHCWNSKGVVCESKCKSCGNYHVELDGHVYCLSYKNSFREAVLKSKSARFGFIKDNLIDFTN